MAAGTHWREALQIAVYDKDLLTPCSDNLEKVDSMLQKFGEEHDVNEVAVVCAMGTKRNGKSFLLNMFVKYASYCEANPPMTKTESFNDWKDVPLEIISPDTHGKEPCRFISQETEDNAGLTKGVFVYPKVFLAQERPDTRPETAATHRHHRPKQFALLVMDTEGSGDSDQPEVGLYVLPCMLSSKIIFNTLKFEQSHLDHFGHIVCAWAAAMESYNEGNSRRAMSGIMKANPDAMLHILARDYKFPSASTKTHEQQSHDMYKRYRDQGAKSGSAAGIIDTQFNHTDAAPKVTCTCLPYIGDKAVGKDPLECNLSELSDDFKVDLHKFFERHLYAGILASKPHVGSEPLAVSGHTGFKATTEALIKVLNDNRDGEWRNPGTFFEVVKQVNKRKIDEGKRVLQGATSGASGTVIVGCLAYFHPGYLALSLLACGAIWAAARRGDPEAMRRDVTRTGRSVYTAAISKSFWRQKYSAVRFYWKSLRPEIEVPLAGGPGVSTNVQEPGPGPPLSIRVQEPGQGVSTNVQEPGPSVVESGGGAEPHADEVYEEVVSSLGLADKFPATAWPKTDPEWAAALVNTKEFGVTNAKILRLGRGLECDIGSTTDKAEKICLILEAMRS